MTNLAASRPNLLTPNVVGVLWMLLAVTALTGMFAIAKHLMTTLPMLETATMAPPPVIRSVMNGTSMPARSP